ncbi:MAG: hypothetical protein AAB728_04370 [Patescibacteria group bacterium]
MAHSVEPSSLLGNDIGMFCEIRYNPTTSSFPMPELSREQVQAHSQQFARQLGNAFIIIGWKKPDGSVDVVQTVHEMNPIEYVKAATWALNEVTSKL